MQRRRPRQHVRRYDSGKKTTVNKGIQNKDMVNSLSFSKINKQRAIEIANNSVDGEIINLNSYSDIDRRNFLVGISKHGVSTYSAFKIWIDANDIPYKIQTISESRTKLINAEESVFGDIGRNSILYNRLI